VHGEGVFPVGGAVSGEGKADVPSGDGCASGCVDGGEGRVPVGEGGVGGLGLQAVGAE